MRQECEDLMERLAALTRSAEQERTELQAQYQRKLAQAQQDRDREVERLRDLQRYVIHPAASSVVCVGQTAGSSNTDVKIKSVHFHQENQSWR